MAQLVHQLVMDASRRLLSGEQAQKCLLENKKTFVTHYESLVHSCDAYLLSSACTHLQQLLNWPIRVYAVLWLFNNYYYYYQYSGTPI